MSLVEGDWKFIRHHAGPKTNLTGNELGNDPKDQLFNIAKDPGERDNVADQEPERVKLMDASGTVEEVTQRLLDAIEDLLP